MHMYTSQMYNCFSVYDVYFVCIYMTRHTSYILDAYI